MVNDRVQFEMLQFSSAWDHSHGNYWDWDTRFFGDHPLLSKPTKQTGKLALSPVWFRARLRMIVIKTEKLGSDLSEPSLTMEKINLRPNVLN